MPETPQLEGRTALVTGGTRGIGRAIAAELRAHGADVVVTGRDKARAESAAAGIGDRVLGLGADVSDPEAVDRLTRAVVDRFGTIDVLVNNAGVGHFGPVADMSVDTWRDVIGTNLTGAFLCSRAVIPYLRRSKGWIVNVGSLASPMAFAGGAAYCASKAGLTAFTEALMSELRDDDVRVTLVLPGSVRTGFGGRDPRSSDDWRLAPEDVARSIVALLAHEPRSLPSRLEIRPARPPKR